MCPVISPNKTIEGAIGGGVSALIVCICIGLFTGLNLIHTIMIALLTTTFAQLGDLAESLIKRDAGVKDSGESIPVHGGFLDRTDGYIFASPAVFYYVYYFIINNHFEILTKFLETISNVIG